MRNGRALTVAAVPEVSLASVTPKLPDGLSPVMKYASPIAMCEFVVFGTPVLAAFCVAIAPQERKANAVALFGACMYAPPSFVPAGHENPGRGPTVAVAVRSNRYAWTRYLLFPAGVNARPATTAFAVPLVVKSAPRMTFVHGSDPPPGGGSWALGTMPSGPRLAQPLG